MWNKNDSYTGGKYIQKGAISIKWKNICIVICQNEHYRQNTMHPRKTQKKFYIFNVMNFKIYQKKDENIKVKKKGDNSDIANITHST